MAQVNINTPGDNGGSAAAIVLVVVVLLVLVLLVLWLAGVFNTGAPPPLPATPIAPTPTAGNEMFRLLGI